MLKYMKHRGFSIVEVAIVITILGILIGLGTVNLNSSRSKARDNERKDDLDTIALHLESYYDREGKYPDVATIEGNEQPTLRDIDPKSLRAPGKSETTMLYSTTSVPDPTVDKDSYLYKPLYLDEDESTNCLETDDECRRFILKVKLEDGSTYSVESKNQ